MNYPSQNIMRNNYPIVDEGFESETGFSWVTIATPDGQFTGVARVHPDDFIEGKFTRLTGSRMAHNRAFIDYMKYLKRVRRNTYSELMQIWATSKKKTDAALALRLRLNQLEFEIAALQEGINKLQKGIDKTIESIEKFYNGQN